MKFFKLVMSTIGAVFMLMAAAHADGAIRIQSLDKAETRSTKSLAKNDKRPPKCTFIWGDGFPAPGASGPGSVKVIAAKANRYSADMERLARDGGVLPLVVITDTHDGKTVTLMLKQVRVQNFQRLSVGAVSADGGTDVLQQEWSIVYETIQRVL